MNELNWWLWKRIGHRPNDETNKHKFELQFDQIHIWVMKAEGKKAHSHSCTHTLNIQQHDTQNSCKYSMLHTIYPYDIKKYWTRDAKKNTTKHKQLCATWTRRENRTDFTCDYILQPQMSKDYLKSRKRRRSRRRKTKCIQSWKAIAHWNTQKLQHNHRLSIATEWWPMFWNYDE